MAVSYYRRQRRDSQGQAVKILNDPATMILVGAIAALLTLWGFLALVI